MRGPGDETDIGGAAHHVAYLDDDIVALVGAGTAQVLVAPRSHAEGLATAPRDAGRLLGALRRAVDAVASVTGSSECRLEPLDHLAVTSGHACYRVRPVSGGPLEAEAARGQALDVERLAAALGRSGATRRGAGGSRKTPTLG